MGDKGPGLDSVTKLELCDRQELPGLLVPPATINPSRVRKRIQLAGPQSKKHTVRWATRIRVELRTLLQIQPAHQALLSHPL